MIFQKYIKKIKIRWLLLPFIFLAALATLFGIFELKYSDRYYPGVMIAGESVSGKTYGEVLQEFKTKSDVLLKSGLTLVFENGPKGDLGKTEINIPATTTGFTPDILVEYFSIGDLQGTVSSAYNWGRKGTVIQRLEEQFDLISGKDFNSPISSHKEAIQSLLSRETKYFLVAGAPAQFSLDKDGEIIITPEKLGDNIDIKNIVDVVLQKFSSFEIQPVVFNMKPVTPYPTVEKLKPFLNLAKELAKSTNVNFYYQNHKWKVNGNKLVTWLTLKSDDEMTIDSKKLEVFLSASVAPLIDDPPQDSRFEMRDGNLVEISPGKSGEAVNIDKTVELIEEIIPRMQQSSVNAGDFTAALVASDSKIKFDSKNNTIDIPIETIKVDPEITQKTIDQYKIKDLVGRAMTNFTGGSLDRQHNIEVGVSKLTGILIAPGEEFSTVWNIGDVTEEAGFVKEYVIKGYQTVKELGGGLCQLATTLFRTALSAGLPITERVNHEYVIPYYGPGLDATIYGPHPDFRFVNDTGNYLLLQGTAKNNEVVFELYGTADGRKAEVSTPVLSDEKPVPKTRDIMSPDLPQGVVKCQTATHKGITADTTYTVLYPDGSKKDEVFHSVYQPWPEVCLIGGS
jgi:vancomycin resistance protein YoaR